MIRRLPTLLLLFALSFTFALAPAQAQLPQGPQGGGEHADAKQNAREVAEEWLELTDAGQFGQSWDEAATMMQDQIEREQWEQRSSKVHKQLGEVQQRQFAQAQYRDSIQTPQNETLDGPFVILMYQSQFGQAGQILEQLITVKRDGSWKVAGYQPRKPPQRGPQGQGGGQQGPPGQGGGGQ